MRISIKAFFGAFFGKLLASLFIAACVLLGFGPDKWAAFMIQNLPYWITPAVARSGFLALGLITAVSLWKISKTSNYTNKNKGRIKSSAETLYPLHSDKAPWWEKLWQSRVQQKDRDKVLNNPTTPDEKQFLRGWNHARARQVSTRAAALEHLAKLRTEGVIIRNDSARLFAMTEVDHWMDTAVEWMNDVMQTLRIVSTADSEWFSTLDAVPPARISITPITLQNNVDAPRFLASYEQHDFRLLRLEDLLKKYGVGA